MVGTSNLNQPGTSKGNLMDLMAQRFTSELVFIAFGLAAMPSVLYFMDV